MFIEVWSYMDGDTLTFSVDAWSNIKIKTFMFCFHSGFDMVVTCNTNH